MTLGGREDLPENLLFQEKITGQIQIKDESFE